jgi:hypothetical protein
MHKIKVSIDNLHEEVSQIQKSNPTLPADAAFVFWFLKAYLTDQDTEAKGSLTGKQGGRTGEKNLDAVFIDHRAGQCHIIQGKYHKNEGASEKRNDVFAFAMLSQLPWEEKSHHEAYLKKLDPLAATKIKEALHCIQKKGYSVKLYYVSTGRCTPTIIEEAENVAAHAEGPAEFRFISGRDILGILENYIDGIAPAIPLLKLKIVSDGNAQREGIIRRYDPNAKIESWVFSMSGSSVGEMFKKCGVRLFAKNIRGFLGNTDINESMVDTIKKEPHNFWYYNNGVTIVCDSAKLEAEAGENMLRVEGAQVINGQQTTRTLEHNGGSAVNVLVKVISVPREHCDGTHRDRLINSIVRATNFQNHIEPSDLVANDYIQVWLERELRKVGYQYIRKRMSKSEARSIYGQGYWQIDKRELAQAIAACLFDPVVVRKGREGLFEDPYYNQIFSTKNIPYYLSKFWLMKQVQTRSYGYPERGYAKWLALNFLWRQVGADISAKANESKFRSACERRDSYVLSPLHTAIDAIFQAAIKFYYKNRGVGDDKMDVSNFFKGTRLDLKFAAYWDSRGNTCRMKFNSNLKKFYSRSKEV